MNHPPMKCPVNISSLFYDTACLQIQNDLEYPVNLFSVSSECTQCDPDYWTRLPLLANLSLVAKAVHPLTLSAARLNEDVPLCEQTVLFNQHGLYLWNIKNCTVTVVEKGDITLLPLYVMIACSVSLILFIALGRALYHSRWIRNLFIRDPALIDMQDDLGNPHSSTDSLLIQSELVPLQRVRNPRIQALDTFRGITIALMIFVNYGGGKFWFFEHSAWNGLTIADLVFPWFAWVMGVSLVLSYRSKLRSCLSRLTVLRVSLRRALNLITLGLLLNSYGNNDLASVRFCGVLQRLGVAHFVVSGLEIAFMKKQPSFQRRQWVGLLLCGIQDCWRQWIVICLLASAQVYTSLCWPVVGCPTGYLGPGGKANHSYAVNCTGGIARHIDSLVFTDKHMYLGHVHKVYQTTVPFDPEGILGTLTTCLTVYLGVLAGYIILSYSSTLDRTVRWMFWAIITGVTAGFLCGWSQEGGWIPVNKQLWSLSFALITSSAAFTFFTFLFILIDHCQCWTGHPFRHAGMNAILLYVGHIVTKNTFPWSWKPHDLTNHGELLTMNIGAVSLWLIIAKVLYSNDIFLTL